MVSKTYDGTTSAGTAAGKLAFLDMVPGDDLSVAATPGVYADANVGNKTVTLTLGNLTGKDAGNYVKAPGFPATFDTPAVILPAAYTFAVTPAQQVRVGGGLAKLTHPDTGTGIKVSGTAEVVNGTFGWYKDAACTQAAADTDLSSLTVGTVKTLYWKFTAANTGVGANYLQTPVTGAVAVTIVSGYPQTIAFANATKTATYGDADFTVAATQNTTKPGDATEAEFAQLPAASAFTYTSSNPAVATVDNTGKVTVLKVGTTTITATSPEVAGVWAKGTASYVLTVEPKTVALTWLNNENTTYDNTARNVIAQVNNKAAASDEVNVTVTGGNQIDAGEYDATATGLTGAAAANYKLPAAAQTMHYVIVKANRTLTLDPTTKTLVGANQTFTIKPTVSADLDGSAKYVFTSGNLTAATVTSAGLVTAVGNGTATITVTVPATKNYNEATAACAVTSVAAPVTGAGVTSSGTDDKLAVVVEGNTIKVTGAVTEGKDITVTPTTASGATASPITIPAADVGKTKTVDVTVNGQKVTYNVDTSAVVVMPANVKVTEASAIDAAGITDVTYKPTDAGAENVAAAVTDTVVKEAQQKAAGLTDAQKTALGNPTADNTVIEAQVNTEVKVTKAASNDVELTVTPTVTYVAKNTTDPNKTVTLGTENIEAKLGTQLITVSVTVPAGTFTAPDSVVVKHTMINGGVEYRIPTVSGSGPVTFTWTQHGASPVILTGTAAAAKSVTVNFLNEDGTAYTSKQYSVEDIGTSAGAFPTLDKSGYTFGGWNFTANGKNYTKATALTIESFNDIATSSSAATPVFTANGGDIVIGGGGSETGKTFAITAAAGEGGTISPATANVASGKNQTFTITPNAGYKVKDVLVDGKSVGAVSSYTFSKVDAAHTIAATFEKTSQDVLANYTDVSGHWAEDAIRFMVANGYMNGMTATTFGPNIQMNRAMLVTILYRVAGSPAVSGGSVFSDVADGAWYADAVKWAASNGIVLGMGDGRFAPLENVTRQQLAAILYRYVRYTGGDVSGAADLSGYSDVGSVAAWAMPAMQWAVSAGIISGRTATTIVPTGTATRAEVATMLFRYLSK
jgi:hypothetical protein